VPTDGLPVSLAVWFETEDSFEFPDLPNVNEGFVCLGDIKYTSKNIIKKFDESISHFWWSMFDGHLSPIAHGLPITTEEIGGRIIPRAVWAQWLFDIAQGKLTNQKVSPTELPKG